MGYINKNEYVIQSTNFSSAVSLETDEAKMDHIAQELNAKVKVLQ
jgi:hypothetical protein